MLKCKVWKVAGETPASEIEPPGFTAVNMHKLIFKMEVSGGERKEWTQFRVRLIRSSDLSL